MYDYDENGNRTNVTMPDGETITTKYDARGRIIKQIDQNGHEISYEYDSLGRVIKTINSKGKESLCEYDEAGNIITYIDYSGITTSYTYDEQDRMVKKEILKGSERETINYFYTIDGKLLSVTDNNGTISYTYDMMDGLTKIKGYDGKEINYSYDEALRLTGISTPYGETTYEYDILDRLTRVVSRDGTATLYEYDVNGNRTSVKYEGGIVTSYEYDDVNRLIKEETIDKESNLIARYVYTLGKAGERVKVEESGPDGRNRVVEYEYDQLYRLVKETTTDSLGTKTTQYSYDLNSNRLSKDEDDKKTKYNYNELNQLILEDNKHYVYDDNGNLTKVSIDGVLIAYYTRGADLISLEREGKKHYYLYDGHNSVRMLVDEEGNITDTYTYDAFGNLLDITATTENDYLYCGEQFNGSTGLYYLRARYMNPSTGTFISMDKYQGTINDPISLHKYLYANANPVMYTDPTGYQSYTETMVSVTIMEILSETTVINLAFAFSIIAFLTTRVEVNDNPPVIVDIGQVILDLLDGISRVGDVVEDIRDDVISRAESDTDKGEENTEQLPDIKYPGNDPTKSPGKDWQ